MKNIIFLAYLIFAVSGCAQNNSKIMENKKENSNMGFRTLTKAEEAVIVYKQTERPFTGEYDDFYKSGTYVCRRCGAELYKSKDKFDAGCGWPAFDDEIKGAVKRIPDADGMRVEIVCAKCDGHLGHVFLGENLTSKNTRHCVNSISLLFIPDKSKNASLTDTAIVAGGCFWGVEYYMHKIPGIISTEVGYIGGNTQNPTYRDVCSHTTGHAEAVRIIFNPSKTTYEAVIKMFFEIHDPTQVNRQGPDVGDQYRSEIFYFNADQKAIDEKLIGLLKQKGLNISTKLSMASTFWKAEEYHQQYYEKEGQMPYCHKYTKRF